MISEEQAEPVRPEGAVERLMQNAGQRLAPSVAIESQGFHRLARILAAPDMAFPSFEAGWHCAAGDGPVTVICGDGAQRFGGLFEAFFEHYWVRFTSLKRVVWRCRVTGPAEISVLRRDGINGSENRVAHWHGVGDGSGLEVLLPVDLVDDRGAEPYLVVEVSSASGAILSEMAWLADKAPPRAVRIGVVITTFNREAFLQANLRKLAGHLADAEVIVVNHGAAGLEERLAAALPANEPIRFIDQENSGGAGGFTRGMIEHLAAGRLSHVLLMDDDIDLPPDLVERVAAVLAWADKPLCVGGAMFDYQDRTRLFSAGDVLLPDRFGIGHVAPPEGCDVSQVAGVDFLARLHTPDFNGWWCFAFSLEAMEQVGLPMPCFIRGDDVEYGFRLKQAGWPTVGWPGIAVWHMPFADKSAPWHMFYDRRNSLFANAIHRRVGRWAALSQLAGGFYHHLLRYDYDRVRAMTLGIAAFNRGAAAMAAWTHHDHARLIGDTRRYGERAARLAGETRPVAELRRLRGWRRPLAMTPRLLADLFWPWRGGVVVGLPAGAEWRPDCDRRPSRVIETGADGQRRGAYRYNWAAGWLALARCSVALAGMVWRFHQQVPLAPTNDGGGCSIEPAAAGKLSR
jgi:GT2 family glycosyltransferase